MIAPSPAMLIVLTLTWPLMLIWEPEAMTTLLPSIQAVGEPVGQRPCAGRPIAVAARPIERRLDDDGARAGRRAGQAILVCGHQGAGEGVGAALIGIVAGKMQNADL